MDDAVKTIFAAIDVLVFDVAMKVLLEGTISVDFDVTVLLAKKEELATDTAAQVLFTDIAEDFEASRVEVFEVYTFDVAVVVDTLEEMAVGFSKVTQVLIVQTLEAGFDTVMVDVFAETVITDDLHVAGNAKFAETILNAGSLDTDVLTEGFI